MKDKADVLADNEREWRKYMLNKIDKIDEDVTNLKIQSKFVSAFFGALGGLITLIIGLMFK